jgi:methanogenic corrinoid protein MtbC1
MYDWSNAEGEAMGNNSRIQDERRKAAPESRDARVSDARALLTGAKSLPRGLVSIVKEQGPEGLGDLLATIHEKIIPQLLLAHYDEEAPLVVEDRIPSANEVARFADISTRGDVNAAVAFVEWVSAQGTSLEVILLDLVAPAARLLGEDWTNDLRTFTDVTLGLGILQQVVHTFGPALAAHPGHRGCVVLVPAPSEQHTLGIHVLGEFLRKAGWNVQVETAISRPELVELVEAQPVELVGISISNGDLVEPLSHLVTALRRAPLNPEMAVMMGGSLQLTKAEHLRIGATFCNDPREAVDWLDEHMRRIRDRATNM